MDRLIKGVKVSFSPLVKEKLPDNIAEYLKQFFHKNNVVCTMCKLPFGLKGTAPAVCVRRATRVTERIYIHQQRIGCPTLSSPDII